MDIEKDIIQDQKETIHRLQEECKEKTDIIMTLGRENTKLKEETYGLNYELLGYKKGVQASEIIELKQALEKIKEIAEKRNYLNLDEALDDILDKINEVLGNE